MGARTRSKKRHGLGDLSKALAAIGKRPDDPLGRLVWERERARITERHRRRLRDIDVQEINYPTEEIAVDDPEAKKRTRKNITRVRQSEAWRHKQLTPMQRQAESEMGLAWQARTAGLANVTAQYGDVRGGGSNGLTLGAGLDQTWRDWVAEAKQRKIHIAVVIDCIAEPKTLADIERDRKLKRGKALAIYLAGLDAWCELRGWLRGSPSTIVVGLTPSERVPS